MTLRAKFRRVAIMISAEPLAVNYKRSWHRSRYSGECLESAWWNWTCSISIFRSQVVRSGHLSWLLRFWSEEGKSQHDSHKVALLTILLELWFRYENGWTPLSRFLAFVMLLVPSDGCSIAWFSILYHTLTCNSTAAVLLTVFSGNSWLSLIVEGKIDFSFVISASVVVTTTGSWHCCWHPPLEDDFGHSDRCEVSQRLWVCCQVHVFEQRGKIHLGIEYTWALLCNFSWCSTVYYSACQRTKDL